MPDLALLRLPLHGQLRQPLTHRAPEDTDLAVVPRAGDCLAGAVPDGAALGAQLCSLRVDTLGVGQNLRFMAPAGGLSQAERIGVGRP